MKHEDILEYYPNKQLKYKIEYYLNGCKYYEQYYDQNGDFHREASLPDYQKWYDNGHLFHRTFFIHGKYHNISNPADIFFTRTGKIDNKYYHICDDNFRNKLIWNNFIKNII